MATNFGGFDNLGKIDGISSIEANDHVSVSLRESKPVGVLWKPSVSTTPSAVGAEAPKNYVAIQTHEAEGGSVSPFSSAETTPPERVGSPAES